MIKKIYILALLVTIALFAGCSDKEHIQKIDVTDYNITLGFSSPKEIVISADVSCTTEENVSHMEFLLNAKVVIRAILLKHNDGWTELTYEREDETLRLAIPDSIVSTDRVLRFEYLYPLDQMLGSFFYIDRGYRWYPLIIDDVVRVKITATVFPGFKMFSCGDLVEEQESGAHPTYTWETNIPVFKIPVVLIRKDMYDKVTATCNDNEIDFYVLEENPETDPHIAGEASAMFGFCESLIGTYPHKNLTFIETDAFESMSFIASGLVLVSSDFMEQFRHGYTQGLHLPIAMQWFGSGVFATFQNDGFWFFSLSLPHYLRLMAVQRFEGNESFSRTIAGPYDMYLVYTDTEDDMPIVNIDMLNSPAKGYAITGKGPLIFDHLRQEMGIENWQSFLSDLYKTFLGKTMSYEDFSTLLSQYTDPKTIKEFDSMTHSKGDLPR